MSDALWTPDRDIPLHTKGVQAVSPREMKLFAEVHDLAAKLNIELRCPRCGESFRGLNDGWAREQSVFCGCREIKAVVGGNVIQPVAR